MTHEQIENFKNWLKENRAVRHITQEALAEYVNASVATIRAWERDGPTYNYIPHALTYFFNTWERNPLRKGSLDEIPDHPTLATGKWLTWWLDTEGVTAAELAAELGITKACVYNWKKPDTKISIIAEYAIRQAMKELTKQG